MKFREEQIGDARPVWVYALCEPGGVNPRYVGITRRHLHQRHKEHISLALRGSKKPVYAWIRRLYTSGQWSCIKAIELVRDGDWEDRERYWISSFRSDGFGLFNLTDGGQGKSWTDEEREALSKKLRRGSFFDCEWCGANFWRKPHEIKKGNCRFCSRECYQKSQRGKSKPVSAECTRRGVSASARARKSRTHCCNNHEFTPENTYVNKRGARVCRICLRASKKKYMEARNG